MGITGLKLGKKLGIPTVSNYTTNFAQYLRYYNLDILKNAAWSYMNWFHNQNELTLCPSAETKELIMNHGIQNVEIFSRGIDSVSFNAGLRSTELRQSLGINDKIVLLYVGRVAPEKDIDVLCESYREISDKYGDKVALIITGEGPELQRCKKEFPTSTIFTGYKKGKELAEIYSSSDIFVFPSPTETFGNVVLEAMASGLPVIAANAGGVKETVRNEVNGLLFRPGDSQELTHLIKKLIEDKSLRNSLRDGGNSTVLQRSWDNIFDGLIDTYNKVLFNLNENLQEIS